MANKLICRICLKREPPKYCVNISPEAETSNILEMLNYCVPELDIFLVINPVMCRSCVNLLETAFKFKMECLKSEEKFLNFYYATNSKVDLSNIDAFNNNANWNIIKAKEITDVEIIKVERVSSDEIIQKSEGSRKVTSKSKKASKKSEFNCQQCYGCENKLDDPSYHSKMYKSPYECYNCGKQFKTIFDIRKHMMNHRRPRQCKVCHRFFRDLHQLTTHFRTHTGAKPFECNLCTKSFRQKHNLDQHLRQHQGHITVKCKICDKSFSTKYNLKIHMLNVHIKKPQCELCSEKFYTKAALIKHLETDTVTCRSFVKTEVSFEEQVIKIEPRFLDTNDVTETVLKEECCENKQESTFEEEVDIMN